MTGDRDLVLAALRSAGPRGVALYALRVRLGGRSAAPILKDLRAGGHRIVRCPGDRGHPLAILFERGTSP